MGFELQLTTITFSQHISILNISLLSNVTHSMNQYIYPANFPTDQIFSTKFRGGAARYSTPPTPICYFPHVHVSLQCPLSCMIERINEQTSRNVFKVHIRNVKCSNNIDDDITTTYPKLRRMSIL